jgi:hypothetical protein
MNILDENVLADQRQVLLSWRVPFRGSNTLNAVSIHQIISGNGE